MTTITHNDYSFITFSTECYYTLVLVSYYFSIRLKFDIIVRLRYNRINNKNTQCSHTLIRKHTNEIIIRLDLGKSPQIIYVSG